MAFVEHNFFFVHLLPFIWVTKKNWIQMEQSLNVSLKIDIVIIADVFFVSLSQSCIWWRTITGENIKQISNTNGIYSNDFYLQEISICSYSICPMRTVEIAVNEIKSCWYGWYHAVLHGYMGMGMGISIARLVCQHFVGHASRFHSNCVNT